jgi:subtilase family serine protease
MEKRMSDSRNPAWRAPFVLAFIVLVIIAAAGCASHDTTIPAAHGQRTTSNIAGALPGTSPTPVPADWVPCAGDSAAVACHAQQNKNAGVSGAPQTGLTPAQLRSAYGLAPSSSAPSATAPLVAVVDAFEDRSAESDLAAYRAQFGLPPCSSKSGCFTKVIMTGTITAPGQIKKYLAPGTVATWSDEIALDLAMVSAACPACRILLVEAGANDLDSLASGVSLAASHAPAAIAVSWGVPESGNLAGIDPAAQAAFYQPGIAIAASAGDTGAVQFPASSPYVTAVGGTTLTAGGGPRGWAESAWAATGAGCSALFPLPAWQTAPVGCTGRAVPDVSLVADFATGVAVYSSVQGGWIVLGGTSVGAPFVAGLYAAANDYGAESTGARNVYAKLASLNAVTGGGVSPNGLSGF